MLRVFFLLSFLFPALLQARVLPAEGSVLNYRIAGFTASALAPAAYYRLEVAKGEYNSVKDFEKNIILTNSDTSRYIIQLLPAFSQSYTWRLSSIAKQGSKKAIDATPLCHFTTGIVPAVDTTKNRLRILDKATMHQDMLVFTDYKAVIYNMQGEPVWYLPEMKDAATKDLVYRDFKPTSTGTFTAICSEGIFEFDYDGNILWRGPLNGSPRVNNVEYYHHDFTKLPNGNYLILGNESITRQVPPELKQTMRGRASRSPDSAFRINAGTLIEYDSTGKIVWEWKSAQAFSDEEYFSVKTVQGIYEPNMHLNAAYFDESRNEIYLSFRNINMVMRIAYPSGKVICKYGKDDNLFKGQHSARLSSTRQLYMFNNNAKIKELGTLSYISSFALDSCAIRKVWEFPCDIDTNAKARCAVGGSVMELPGGDILTCMGVCGRVFIVSPQKKVLWNAIPENKIGGTESWVPSQMYRADYLHNIEALRPFIFR